jgi:hypothetical protein
MLKILGRKIRRRAEAARQLPERERERDTCTTSRRRLRDGRLEVLCAWLREENESETVN